MVSLTGMDESVTQLINDNVSTAFDGEIPVNVSYCDAVCGGIGGTIDVGNPNILSSVSYSFGGGYGIEAGVDLATATDWGVYGSDPFGDSNIVINKSPRDIPEMFSEAWNDLKRDFGNFRRNMKR